MHWENAIKRRSRRDSNAQPTDSKSGTLSIELREREPIIPQIKTYLKKRTASYLNNRKSKVSNFYSNFYLLFIKETIKMKLEFNY